MTDLSGVEVRAPQDEPRQEEILTPGALAFVADLQRTFGARRDELLAARAERRTRSPDRHARLPGRDRGHPRRPSGRWHRRRPRCRTAGSRSPARPTQDGDQRAELRRQGVAGRPRGRQHPALGERDRGAGRRCTTRTATSSSFTSPRARSTRSNDGDLAVPVVRPRGWHLDERHVLVDGSPMVGALVDFGLYFFHNAERAARARARPVLLPAEDGEPPRGAALERRLHPRAGRARHPARHVRATVLIETIPAAFEMEEILYELREHASGLNAGRWDYLFSIIKNFRDAGADVRAAGPRRGDDDGAVHAGLHRAAGRDLPPARRVRDGRHGRVHPEPPRPGGQRGRAGEGPRGQGARGRRRLRRLVGGAPRPGADLPGGVRRACSATSRTSSTGSATTCASTAADLLDVAATAGRGDRAGRARQRLGGAAVPRVLAARQRRGRASTT